ncbi:MAG TPA: RidA family protein [Dehalococcoidia bacterium]|jgi:enamine deaminase RidA (YjgF/YER057c/UK114 family)|nr:RidA family protein [Dehalococcoidia bacterium]
MTAVEHMNPQGLVKNPAFTQVVAIAGPHRTVYVGGQNAVDAEAKMVGRGDLRAQVRQVFANLKVALGAAGARLEHIVKWNIYIVAGQPLQPAFEVFREEWGQRPNPPTVSVLYVSALAFPDYLVELDAVAVIPE